MQDKKQHLEPDTEQQTKSEKILKKKKKKKMEADITVMHLQIKEHQDLLGNIRSLEGRNQHCFHLDLRETRIQVKK